MNVRNERIVVVDILKFFAALLITNSHLGGFYGEFSYLSRGAYEGNFLFFLCSGFTLFFKPLNGIGFFPDWYRRRLVRIYPSLFAVAILSSLFVANYRETLLDVLFAKSYWFISCIMIHYVAIYFIGSYLRERKSIISFGLIVLSMLLAYHYYLGGGRTIWDGHFVTRYVLSFVVLLMGAHLGEHYQKITIHPIGDLFLFVVYYLIFMACGPLAKNGYWGADYLRFFPLLGSVYYFYKVCSSPWVNKIYSIKSISFIVRVIGGLSLEIYIVQRLLLSFGVTMRSIFPFNIILAFFVVIVTAYLTRCLARFVLQSFKEDDYNWRKIVSLL